MFLSDKQARYLADAYNTNDAEYNAEYPNWPRRERNFVVVKRFVGEWEIA